MVYLFTLLYLDGMLTISCSSLPLYLQHCSRYHLGIEGRHCTAHVNPVSRKDTVKEQRDRRSFYLSVSLSSICACVCVRVCVCTRIPLLLGKQCNSNSIYIFCCCFSLFAFCSSVRWACCFSSQAVVCCSDWEDWIELRHYSRGDGGWRQ